MSHRTSTQRRTWKERALSLLLAAALMSGLVPGLTLPASAEHWADAYLDQLVDWGVMRADQTANPDAALTRAEFFAIINRAYGYTETGYIPFEDVLETDWFYDDISIAYTAGYMAGTSPTTASPNDPLTREQAFCILGRNMMLRDAPGESLAFADSRDVSDWARGTIKAAADNYIISGYPDNTLHPLDSISKGQMAVLISQCLGTPIRASGTYDLGGVFGNVTITAPNVTLRNATISGDLYISGGVGLGGIKLENVDVLGRIIVSGTGESEDGGASVIMRNVTADEMLVDNMRNKTVTIRADGITDIARTVVRTNAYLEDNNTDDKGLMRIELDGSPGTRLTLAGRIKEVLDKTPSSYIQVAKGTVAKLTVDETATNSTIQIDRNTKVTLMNLDVATSVLGDGDIGKLNINAPGSVVSMLPDDIYIRPGLNASIAGVIMDYQSAEEGSLDPRLLSGYPAAKDIAPTGFRADFAGNKKGTIYWAVSYVSDGSIGEEDLISPPSYGNKAIANGSVEEPAGGQEVSAQVGNLVVGGSYYLSAMLVDDQKERSPVKVISFSTPDNTVPAFAQGYPQMSRISSNIGESLVTVMPTKNCKLYYALLPQGAQAPTANELKAAAVTGNLGYGVRDVVKNTESVFPVNSQQLEELKTYVLYLWLTDADGANSSAVTSLQFTIPDETPPEFVVHPYMNGNALATSVPMAATVNEDATIFWAVVEEGAAYPLPAPPDNADADQNVVNENGQESSSLFSNYAKLCVTSGMGALQRGQVAARANTEVTFNITGLAAEKSYDLYYLARDTAGNYTVQVYKLQGGIHTQDSRGPIVTQSFSWLPSTNDPTSFMASADIYLDFSENIYSTAQVSEGKDFLTLYNESKQSTGALRRFANTLAASIVLYRIYPDRANAYEEVAAWNGIDGTVADWVVNYSNVRVESQGDGKIRVIFPGTDDPNPAIRLANGATYYFELRDIYDLASPANPLLANNNKKVYYRTVADANAPHYIPVFSTIFSEVLLSSPGFADLPERKGAASSSAGASGTPEYAYARQDMNFRLNPQSTQNTDDTNRFDILIYTDSDISYDLYYRIARLSSSGQSIPVEAGGVETPTEAQGGYREYLLTDYSESNGPDANGWRYLGNKSVDVRNAQPGACNAGASMSYDFLGMKDFRTNYPMLNKLSEDLVYEFTIAITRINSSTDQNEWVGDVWFEIYVEASSQSSYLHTLAGNPSHTNRQTAEQAGRNRMNGVDNIGLEPNEGLKYLRNYASFSNPQAPEFVSPTPFFTENERDTRPPDSSALSEPGSQGRGGASLVGDTFVWMHVNLNMSGTIYYVIASPGTVRTRPTGNPNITADALWELIPAHGGDTTMPTFDEPLPREIAAYRSIPDGTVQAKGEEPYNSPGIQLNFRVSGLQPEEDYFVYMVVESDSGDPNTAGTRSDVLVYKIRTTDSAKPKIKLTNRGQLGTVSVDTSDGAGGVASTLEWILFTNQQATDALAETGITSIVVPDGFGTYSGSWSLLDALTTTYDYEIAGKSATDPLYGEKKNGYSLFDMFALSPQKRALDNLVRGSKDFEYVVTESGLRTFDDASNYVSPARWVQLYQEANNGRLPETTDRYIILVIGHNTDSSASDWSTIDSFSALRNVRRIDSEPPKLDGTTSSSGEVTDAGATVRITSYDKDKKTVSGYISLTFDKTLCWVVLPGSELIHVVTGGDTAPTTNPNAVNPKIGLMHQTLPNYAATVSGDQRSTKPFADAAGTNGTITTEGSGVRFLINFDNIAQSGRMTLLDEGYIANDSGITVTGDAKIIIDIDVGYTTTATANVYTASARVTFGTQWREANYRDEELFTTTGQSVSRATAPELVGVTTTNVKGVDSGVYSMDLNLTFDQALYTKTGDTTKPVSGASLATKSTVSYNGARLRDITSSGNGKTFTLSLQGVEQGTIVLPSQTFYDATGQASTTGAIKIEISKETDSSNPSSIGITTPQVTVSFGDFEQTNDLPVK